MKTIANTGRSPGLPLLSLRPRLALVLVSVCFFRWAAAAPAQELLPRPGTMPDQYVTPQPERLFRFESESMLRERMAREAGLGLNPLGLRYEFISPSYPPPPPPGLVVRSWAPLTEVVEPAYLCYGRLYFEQINSERYGWNLGPLQPLLSTGIFYFDLAMLPYQAATEPLRRYECNPGYALPGDPMPLLLYLPQPSLSGSLAEAAAIGLMFVIFP